MTYNFIKDLTKVNYEKGRNNPKYIVIHYTGNATDKAKNNANYFRTVNRGASAHYFVDENDVYQVVEDRDAAWAVGRNYGSNNLFGVVTNYNAIHIEMCSTNSKIADRTYQNTVDLTRVKMKEYGIPASKVYRHWDVCSKNCPGWGGWGANGKDASIWNKFKSDIANGTTSTPPVVNNKPSSQSKPVSGNIDVEYAVMIEGGRTLPFVKNTEDYAGLPGKKIVGLAMRVNNGASIKYRVTTISGKTYPFVTGCNWSDGVNGYAGDGRNAIAKIECYLYSPNSDKYIYYRVAPVGRGYYPAQRDMDRGSGMDGYAGASGVAIDKFQAWVK